MPFVAFGRPWEDPEATHPWVDVDGAAGGALATTHVIERGHERVAWIGWRKDSRIGEDRRAGWSRTMRERGLATTGLAARVEDTVASRPGRVRAAAQRGAAPPRSSAPATPWPWACCTRWRTAASGSARTSRSSASTTPRPPRWCHPDSPRCAQPLEEVAVEVVGALHGLLARPRVVHTPRLLGPSLVVRGSG